MPTAPRSIGRGRAAGQGHAGAWAMIALEHVWLAWSLVFLVPWVVLFAVFPRRRRTMLWASLFTTLFGLSEPLFVPEYWNPPSLFDLAARTGFDIESLIFCFGIGGVSAVLYNILTGVELRPMSSRERGLPRHAWHWLVVASPFLTFALLWPLPWNPIHPAIIAMFVGAAATVACRPDLKRNVLVGSGLFLAYYAVFLIGLEFLAPGYVDAVWNHAGLTGLHVLGIPVEEPLFAVGFGAYWTGLYEHLTWRSGATPPAGHHETPASSAPP